MKILYITPEKPGNRSGGQLCVKQSLIMLGKLSKNIDYIGPKYNEIEIKNNVKNNYFIEENNNKLNGIINIFKGGSSRLYTSLVKTLKNINLKNYDYIYLEFSKWDFVAKLAYKNNIELIVRIHNVEQDYFKNLYRNNRSILGFIKKELIKFKEKKVLKYASIILTLTNNDSKRLKQLYNDEISNKIIKVVPICVSNYIDETNRKKVSDIHNNKLTLLTTGSLWYGPNSDGIIWFINNVLENIKNVNLIIAGSNPNKELMKLTEKFSNIELIADPEDISKYFIESDLYIAPIFYGAGMKVKIAEALSYGLPIVGTEHSFIGYEVENKISSYIANSKNQFISAIEEFNDMKNFDRISMSNKAYELYRDKYSLKNSYRYLLNVVKK